MIQTLPVRCEDQTMGNEQSQESYLEIIHCAQIQLAQLLLPQVLPNVFKLPTVTNDSSLSKQLFSYGK